MSVPLMQLLSSSRMMTSWRLRLTVDLLCGRTGPLMEVGDPGRSRVN